MNQSDFDRLKAVCDKEGYRLESFPGINTFQVFKKDIWDGVEFIDRKTPNWPICKVLKITENNVEYFREEGSKVWCGKEFIHPSTEQAYVEQLKSEAFKRFGEIKEGNVFDQLVFENIGVTGNYISSVNYIKENGYPKGFSYGKKCDTFRFDNVLIYMAGKWATKLPEMVKVTYRYSGSNVINNDVAFHFTVQNRKEMNGNEIGKFLASKLEDYLNK